MRISTAFTIALAIGFCFFTQGCHATCTYPGPPENNTTVATDLTEYAAGWDTGVPVVFACDDGDGRFGTVVQYCQADGTFSAVDRECLDRLPVEEGSIAGMCMAACNISAAVFAMLYSKYYVKHDKDEEGEGEEKSEVV